MARIKVLGGTGYAGAAVVREAAGRGHSVTFYSRRLPDEPGEPLLEPDLDHLEARARARQQDAVREQGDVHLVLGLTYRLALAISTARKLSDESNLLILL